jgi:predicted lipoprotein with Yx(FWY)xxD motif
MRNGRGQRQIRVIRGGRGLAAVTALMLVGGLVVTSTASAQAVSHAKATKVVKQEKRKGFGKILTTTKNRALYIDEGAACTGACLDVWPPLLMPAGKTMPGGAPGLGTVPFGSQLQVTYHGMPLYTFESDHGKSVTGNGVNGFYVATVTAGT